jgi:hypothetical protein
MRLPTMKPWRVLPLVLCAARLSSAQVLPVTSPSQFGPTTLITFAGLAPFAEPTNVDGVGFLMSNGQGPDAAYNPSPPREYGPAEGTTIQNIASGGLNMTISFTNPISEIGFELRTYASVNINLTFFSSGNLLQTVSFPTRTLVTSPDSEFYFYGVASDTSFSQLLLAVQTESASSLDSFEMDNLEFGVPEPGGPILFLLGALLAVLTRSRRHRTYQ